MISVGRSLVCWKSREGPLELVEVVGVGDPGDVPAVGDEAGGDVFGERQRGVALDRDVVIVVNPAEVGELPVAGERGGLGRDAFHHVAVAAEGVDVEIDQFFEAGPIVMSGHPALGGGHADAVAGSLAERAGRGLDARGQPVLRVARAPAVELPEPLDLLERHRWLAQRLVVFADRLDAGQVEQRIEQHRGMAGRQHEAVAVGPDRVGRVEPQDVLPEVIGHGRHGHRRAGVPRIGGLNRVHREGANRVDAGGVQRMPLRLDPRIRVDRGCHRCVPHVGVEFLLPDRSSEHYGFVGSESAS